MSLNLLEKTELWIDEIRLENANLTEMAKAAAHVLHLPEDKVMVVDVRPDHITFDILEKDIPQENILGKEDHLLRALAGIEGVRLTPDTYIHSNGILGMIAVQPENAEEVLGKISEMRSEIVEKVAHRAIVFPTGFELEQNMIEDTNSPYLKEILEENGYTVRIGQVIPDDEDVMTEILSGAVSSGYGLVITSGGVGAENKDHSVESILRVDPDAAAPYIVKYEKGTGRHVKDGVRIGVGQVGLTTLVSLPGPHDEVMMTAPVLVAMLEKQAGKKEIADRLAGILAEKWIRKGFHHHAGGAHSPHGGNG